MAQIFPGRYTAQSGRSIVVFLVGMRINKLWALWSWMSAATMPRFSLAAAAGHVPAISRLEAARTRIAKQETSPDE